MTHSERAALTGELGQVPLWDILQTLQLWSSPGCVEVDGSEELATIHFAGGSIVSARCGLRRDEAAVYRALRLQSGRFTVRRAPEVRRPRMSLPITAAILEGVRRHDECERLRGSLPDEGVLLCWLEGRIPVDLRGGVSDAAELFVVPRTIDEAVRASSEDELSLLQELASFVPRLSKRAVPEFASATVVSASRRSTAGPPRRRKPPALPHRPPAPPLQTEPPIRDDYELIPVAEPDLGHAIAEQSTFEPFVVEPPTTPPALVLARGPNRLPPRALAILAGMATLTTFVVTFAALPAKPAALGSIAPEVARWLDELAGSPPQVVVDGTGKAGPGAAR